MIQGGPAASFTTPPTVVADPSRLSVTTDPTSPTGYTGEFFNSTSTPAGHGFSRTATGTTAACYTFAPKANLPLRVIVFDDTCKSSSPSASALYYGGGWVDDARLAWLTAELQKGQEAGELMILACHIPLNPQKDLTDSTIVSQFAAQSPHTETEVLATLHQYPNLVMVMAGHRHINVVTPQPSPDPTHPENGFWEVETSSLRDFPRNFRTFELHRNSDNTLSIVTTDVDPQVTAGTPAADSLGYAIGALRLFGNTTLSDTSSHVCNAELIKPLTAAMQAKIAGYGARPARS